MSERADIRLQAFVLVTSVLLTGIKFLAWWVTHSNAVLSDAMESIVNVVAGAFALYALILAAKPRDREHPYGHGKVEFISAGIEGSLIVIASVVIIARATTALVQGNLVHELGTGITLRRDCVIRSQRSSSGCARSRASGTGAGRASSGTRSTHTSLPALSPGSA